MTLRAFTAFAAPILLAACVRHDESTLPGTLERDRVELVADANESIVSLPFTEGAAVKAGDVIVVQDRALSTADLDAARAQLAEAEARVDELKNGPRSTTIRAAAARRDAARAQRDDAVRERDRLLGLVARSLVSKSEADRQVAAAQTSEATLREAEADLRELQEGTRSEQLAQARQAADSARATLQGLETTSARLEVRSPIAGTIDALPFHLGEKPARGATVAVLLASTAPFARVHVPEPIRAQVKIGTPATLRIDGIERTFKGQVRFIASEAEFTPYYSLTAADRSRLSFLAEVVIDVQRRRRCLPECRWTSRWSWQRRERDRDHCAATHAKIRRQGRGGSHRPRHSLRPHLRIPGAERLRQVDHAAYALRHAAAQRRPRGSFWPVRRQGRGSHPPAPWLHAAEILAVGRPHHRREPALHGRSVRARR